MQNSIEEFVIDTNKVTTLAWSQNATTMTVDQIGNNLILTAFVDSHAMTTKAHFVALQTDDKIVPGLATLGQYVGSTSSSASPRWHVFYLNGSFPLKVHRGGAEFELQD